MTHRILIFGGTGFIGRSLAVHLRERGFQPVLLARSRPTDLPTGAEFLPWDATTVGPWRSALEGARAVVNLAGKSVDCLKTPDNCDLILRSRVDSTRTIGAALEQTRNRPPVWVQMSTAHIYGDPPRQICTEPSATGYGLAPFVGRAWEAAFRTAKPPEMRGVVLRTSFVIGRNGGALASLSRIVRLGLGGTVGSGRQGMSWLHEYDMNELLHRSIVDEHYRGVYIASAPHPVSNREFMRQLRRALKVPIGLPAPEPLVRLGARLVFRTDPELALYGRYVRSERLPAAGFTFRFPTLETALADLV